MYLATPPFPSYRFFVGAQRSSARFRALEGTMRKGISIASVAVALTVAVTAPAQAQRVHEIRLEADAGKDTYRFVPANISARAGDVLLFRTVSGSPHSIVFEAGGLSGPAHEALNGTMARRAGDLSSPLLSPDGAEYRIVVPGVEPGEYQFFCLPHRAYDMRGTLRVTK
jgi:plastocyanin